MKHEEKEMYLAPAIDVWQVRVENGFAGSDGSTAELEEIPGFEEVYW